MPEMSSAKAFVRAIQTRQTNTTRTLERMFAANPSGPDHPLTIYPNFVTLFGLLDTADALSSGPGDSLPTWAQAVLVSFGTQPGGELQHLDQWPAIQREAVREKMVKSINENMSMRFHWELHDGADEATDIDEADDLSITFKSPKWKVRVVGPDNIIVDV